MLITVMHVLSGRPSRDRSQRAKIRAGALPANQVFQVEEDSEHKIHVAILVWLFVWFYLWRKAGSTVCFSQWLTLYKPVLCAYINTEYSDLKQSATLYLLLYLHTLSKFDRNKSQPTRVVFASQDTASTDTLPTHGISDANPCSCHASNLCLAL
jgi:hypothetical protein